MAHAKARWKSRGRHRGRRTAGRGVLPQPRRARGQRPDQRRERATSRGSRDRDHPGRRDRKPSHRAGRFLGGRAPRHRGVRRALRPHRLPGERCPPDDSETDLGADRSGVRFDGGHPSQGALCLHQPRGAAHDEATEREHHQSGVASDGGPGALLSLRSIEGRHHLRDVHLGAGAGPLRHPGQRAEPGCEAAPGGPATQHAHALAAQARPDARGDAR